MGLFSKKIMCPSCRGKAIKKLFSIKCSTYGCKYFDPKMVGDTSIEQEKTETMTHVNAHIPTVETATSKTSKVSQNDVMKKLKTITSSSLPAIQIEYINFKGEKKMFRGQTKSIQDKGAHISVVVEPQNARITLAKNKIVGVY